MDNEGSGAEVLGPPPARKARRRVLKSPAPERLIIHVCKITGSAQNIFLLKKRKVIVLWAEEEKG